MKLKELKSFLETLTPEQLEQTFVVFDGDEESPSILPESTDISTEDIYWDHGDCLGNYENAASADPDFVDNVEEFNMVPKGTVIFFANPVIK